jgi:hypothetical protein
MPITIRLSLDFLICTMDLLQAFGFTTHNPQVLQRDFA